MEISTTGPIGIGISQANSGGGGIDVYFILYGPFPSLAAAVGQCNDLGNPGSCTSDHNCSGEIVDCSFDPAPTETATIPNAVAGEVYLMLLTNYSNTSGQITFEQTSGTGATDCTIINPCTITAGTATPSACDASNNTYSLSGSISFVDQPTTGTFTITSSCGGTQTFNAPFTSPIAYNFTGLPSNGANCTVTAAFSADPTCTNSINYTAPAACTCSITALTANSGACNSGTNTFTLNGNITFTNAPASGTLTVTNSCGGTQVFNAPFTSPQAYTIN
ncbi:MAG: hypothetical protein IT232_10385, partial [Flavobacteriales bacterium]|nr:hypothetical protein [Flavobacteriales bacterium]